MDTTLRFYNYPSLLDRAVIADARKDWEWHQFSTTGRWTTGGPKFHSTYGKCTLRSKIADCLNLACQNFHTNEMLDEVEKACYEYHPELKDLNYREPTPFDNLFDDNPKLKFVPHENYVSEFERPLMYSREVADLFDEDNLPF